MNKENNTITGALEKEREQIVKKYESAELYRKFICKLGMLFVVSLITAFVTNVLNDYCIRYIPEQIYFLIVITYEVLFVISVVIVIFTSDMKQKKINVGLTIFYGISMTKLFDYSINLILLKIGFIIILLGTIIISVNKFKNSSIAFIIILVATIVLLQNNIIVIKPEERSTFIFCANICMFYLVQCDIQKKIFDKNIKTEFEILRSLVFWMGAFFNLL